MWSCLFLLPTSTEKRLVYLNSAIATKERNTVWNTSTVFIYVVECIHTHKHRMSLQSVTAKLLLKNLFFLIYLKTNFIFNLVGKWCKKAGVVVSIQKNHLYPHHNDQNQLKDGFKPSDFGATFPSNCAEKNNNKRNNNRSHNKQNRVDFCIVRKAVRLHHFWFC